MNWIGLHWKLERKNVIRLLTCCETGELVTLCVTKHVMASYVSMSARYCRIFSADGITTEVIKMLKILNNKGGRIFQQLLIPQ